MNKTSPSPFPSGRRDETCGGVLGASGRVVVAVRCTQKLTAGALTFRELQTRLRTALAISRESNVDAPGKHWWPPSATGWR